MNQNARRALVVGGSLGGLFAAHLLRGAGWNASVFERNEEELTGRGVGLGTHPQLIAILRRAGIAFDETMGIKVSKVICLDRAGKIVVEQSMARTMSGWPRIHQALRDALPARDYRLGKRLCRVDQDEAGVTALFQARDASKRRRHSVHRSAGALWRRRSIERAFAAAARRAERRDFARSGTC